MSVASVRSGAVYTAEDLERLTDEDGRYELVEGELVEMPPPPGGPHGSASGRLHAWASAYILASDLGEVFSAETGFFIAEDPDTVLAPDWAFISNDRMPDAIPEGYLRIVPDIVLETWSPSDRLKDVQAKIARWLDAGVRIVWQIDPRAQVVVVHRAGAEPRALGLDDELTGEEVLPGFSVPVRRLFRGA